MEKEKQTRKRPASQAPESAEQSPTASLPENDEVYIPEADTAEKRRAEERKAAAAGNGKGRRMARKKAADEKKQAEKLEKKRRNADGYMPYQQANNARKQQRNQSFQAGIQTFFSQRNPVVKFFHKEDPDVFGEGAASERQAKRTAEAARKQKIAERLNTPAPIYTQPAVFQAKKLATHLLTILAVVLAAVFGMSAFFKVDQITVSGASAYSEQTICEMSGISIGDNLLTFSRTKAAGQIIAKLPYVKSARIGIRLPDTVNIEIEEASVVYSIQDQDGVWWLINSDGKIVEQTNSVTVKGYTQVLGVSLYQPHAGEFGVAKEDTPVETSADGEVVTAMVTGSQRLKYALLILEALEDNDIVGDAASVDVSQLQDIILWYGTRYQVNLGNIDRISYKITYMKNAIAQMSEYQSGILDVSFTTWPDKAGFTPFA